MFDAWSEYFKPDIWTQAFDDAGVDRDFYTMRLRGDDEIFPWDFIDTGVRKDFLWKECLEWKVK